MDIMALVAAFGGGLFGALIGGLPAFILVGVVAIAGAAITMAGGADLVVGNIAFGSYLGPHVAFVGGFAAAAYAGKIKKIDSGANILLSLNQTGDAKVLLVGGIFGMIGWLLNYLFATVLAIPTDTVALSVVVAGIIARFVFGSTGLTGTKDENRKFIPSGSELMYLVVIGLGFGVLIGGIGASMKSAGVDAGIIALLPVLAFGISALSLIFTQTGFATPGTHHIALVTGVATVASGCNPLIAILFAVIASVLGGIVTSTFNSNVDSHIDPPAVTIFILVLAINLIF